VHPLTEFFEPLRQTRSEMRGPQGTRQSSAVLTIVRDESVFFPIWLRYYSRYFAPQDIHVLDHGSTDGSTEVGGFVRIPVEHETVDIAWMVATVEAHQRRLLERYDIVVAVDVDEIIAPDPEWGALDEYLAGFQEEFVNCLGYEVIHLPDREASFQPHRPVLEQRGFWFAAEGYDKPAVSTVPASWEVGFHGRTDGRLNLDPDLLLIHLHRIDYDLCRARHLMRREWAWNKVDLERGWGTHNRITDDAEFERWYYTEGCFDGPAELVVERIPARLRGVL
jgi:hypothetical protein